MGRKGAGRMMGLPILMAVLFCGDNDLANIRLPAGIAADLNRQGMSGFPRHIALGNQCAHGKRKQHQPKSQPLPAQAPVPHVVHSLRAISPHDAWQLVKVYPSFSVQWMAARKEDVVQAFDDMDICAGCQFRRVAGVAIAGRALRIARR